MTVCTHGHSKGTDSLKSLGFHILHASLRLSSYGARSVNTFRFQGFANEENTSHFTVHTLTFGASR